MSTRVVRLRFPNDASRTAARQFIFDNKTGVNKTIVNAPPRDLVVDAEAVALLSEKNIEFQKIG